MSSIEKTIEIVEALILNRLGKSLSFIQKVVLRESLSEIHKTYAQIALENNYSENYIKQLVAPKLWQLLSAVLGEKVNRTNCRAVLEQQVENSSFVKTSKPAETPQKITLESPEGPVPLTSPLYIERGLELTCCQEILQPGAIIRIKGPKKMGKTSLMTRIFAYGSSQNYHTVRLSFYSAEKDVFSSVEKFLRWLCANVNYQLGLESKLEDHWHEDLGALINCTLYFQDYVLNKISNPIILALDEVNHLLEYPNLARDFLALLRTWHERNKDISIWQKLRLILVNSTDIYISLSTNRSPFNIGLTIELPSFTKLQVEDLAQRHGLQLTSSELEQLMELTEGFPYLVRLALYHSIHRQIPVEILLQDAATDTGIFSDHLHEQLWYLQQNPNLAVAFQQAIATIAPISLRQEVAFKLKSLGLLQLEGKQATVSCGLYREYFASILASQRGSII